VTPHLLVDLSALVEGICQGASDTGEPVTFSGPRGVTISGRPTALRRAVSNLVDNAVKYGKSAAVSLIPETDCVVILVDDEGPGIPRSERENVFEPFYRIGEARDPDTGGVGLGLSVTRSIVWEHGGDIILGNRKGGGLRVSVKLPVGQRSIPDRDGTQPHGQKPEPSSGDAVPDEPRPAQSERTASTHSVGLRFGPVVSEFPSRQSRRRTTMALSRSIGI
jgi:hypothetical protein